MSRLFRTLTAVVFMVHLMVGCCWHHAHACDNQDHLPQAAATIVGQCHESLDSGAGVDHQNHGPLDCQGSKCSFVQSSSSVSNLFAQTSLAGFMSLLGDQRLLVGTSSKQRFFATDQFLLSVRLHLANQVLLI